MILTKYINLSVQTIHHVSAARHRVNRHIDVTTRTCSRHYSTKAPLCRSNTNTRLGPLPGVFPLANTYARPVDSCTSAFLVVVVVLVEDALLHRAALRMVKVYDALGCESSTTRPRPSRSDRTMVHGLLIPTMEIVLTCRNDVSGARMAMAKLTSPPQMRVINRGNFNFPLPRRPMTRRPFLAMSRRVAGRGTRPARRSRSYKR